MSDEKDGERHKKVTAATTDAPMEEFISPVNQPSVPEDGGAPEPDRPVQKPESSGE